MLNRLVYPTDRALLLYELSQWAAAAAIVAAVVAVLAFLIVLRKSSVGLKFLSVWLILCAFGSGIQVYLSGFIREHVGPQRIEVLGQMKARPKDPWPRGSGHVPLAAFGVEERSKGYLEPGGAFSPTVGSFGVSFWIVDDAGGLVATSDNLPLDRTSAHYIVSAENKLGVDVETEHYVVRWTVEGERRFGLTLRGRAKPGQHIELAFRGVGPAGGGLYDVHLTSDSTLVLNRSWLITMSPSAQPTFLGEEGVTGWTASSKVRQSTAARVVSATGWGHVRFAVPREVHLTLEIREQAPEKEPAQVTAGGLSLDGVSDSFAQALAAQITTLKLGVVGDQTRPGDPLNYPLQWLRDGAYVLVALARSGETELARRLSHQFAHQDFFGGFGAEADAPGLAIWALQELSTMLMDTEFDREIWPHVQRKAGLIRKMIYARAEVRESFSGPVVPHHAREDVTFVAGPSRNGLIDGRMDWRHPLFFVNAVSYTGLASAAKLAERLGHESESSTLASDAHGLKDAWRSAFLDEEAFSDQLADDRTAIFGLWPSGIAERGPYRELLEQRWKATRDTATGTPLKRPEWTYFTIAEAHQWLQLDRPDRAWQTINYFWREQPIPGLFTLWEGSQEENSFGLWKHVRGWIKPPNVTPHYWSAAEMLLLQLAMLAETHGEGSSSELVIGAGVCPEWLQKPLAVSGVGTSSGVVDWVWDGENVRVTIHGKILPVRLSPAFPPTAKLHVSSLER